MITPHSLAWLLPLLFWAFLIGLLATGVLFAVLAMVRKLPYAIWAAGGALVLALLLTLSATTSLWSSFWAPAGGPTGALIALLGSALAVFGGGPIAQLALTLATRGSVAPGAHGGILVAAPAAAQAAAPASTPVSASESIPGSPAPAAETPAVETREVLRGGAAIGVLERLCVVLGIVAGFPEALAIVIAVKGLGRFTELAAAEARERFIIGTLASLLWASACAVLVRLALS
ncbi:hypothetical protein [Microterricola viridarii]|uniref:Uncharacterized protein n=1 Tax=Microterricola viridarii TaxID=412690 RepID=A0A120I0J2_9MICO|nr:hypothetical protein [Microterricola viridarii]AMB58925.1 hypothetical protein AWU67_08675 [Microterricola viridarii]